MVDKENDKEKLRNNLRALLEFKAKSPVFFSEDLAILLREFGFASVSEKTVVKDLKGKSLDLKELGINPLYFGLSGDNSFYKAQDVIDYLERPKHLKINSFEVICPEDIKTKYIPSNRKATIIPSQEVIVGEDYSENPDLYTTEEAREWEDIGSTHHAPQ